MTEEFTVDMSKGRRRKRRSKRDVERFWGSRYNTFREAGFTDEEASWAADEGLSPRNKAVELRVRMRKARVKAFQELYDMTREEAIEKASKDLRTKLDEEDIEEWNIFYETS